MVIDGLAINSWVKFDSTAGSPVVNADNTDRFSLVYNGSNMIGFEACTLWGEIGVSQQSQVFDVHVSPAVECAGGRVLGRRPPLFGTPHPPLPWA